MSRKPLVVGNWKMNGSLASVSGWVESFQKLCAENELRCDSGLCVPSVYVVPLVQALNACSGISGFEPGAEDVSVQQPSGAFTGEVSAVMLKDAGAVWCIAGHSERRTIYGETDLDVSSKVKVLAANGLRPILCVGETLEERNAGKTREVVVGQINAVIEKAGIEALAAGAVAYEPLWAIGTGVAAGTDQIEPVHAEIRTALKLAGGSLGESIRILYGGSVKPSNAKEIMSLPDVDGALVGGASLAAENFYQICAALR